MLGGGEGYHLAMNAGERLLTLPVVGRVRNARISRPTRQGLLRGVLVYRWITWAWVTAVVVVEVYQRNISDLADEQVAHPGVGFALVGLIGLFNAWLTKLYQQDPDALLSPVPVLSELFFAAALLMADVWVYGFPDHDQALPSVWVVAGVMTTAIAAGQRAAVIAGGGLGLARYVGWLPYAEADGIGDLNGFFSLGRIASAVLLMVTGWVGGYILKKLEHADRSISAYRAREEVARTLHDGVLQTLAVIQRRSEDTQLVELARDQELELREYLFGSVATETDLASGLRAVARRAERRYGYRVDVICAPDLPTGSAQEIHTLSGAVTEALTNASKHGGAAKVVVYAEPFDEYGPSPIGADHDRGSTPSLFVSVKDDGSGFDPAETGEGEGLSRSIRGRLSDAGGTVEIDGRPGRGAEVRMWI